MKKFLIGYYIGSFVTGALIGVAIYLGVLRLDPKLEAHLTELADARANRLANG